MSKFVSTSASRSYQDACKDMTLATKKHVLLFLYAEPSHLGMSLDLPTTHVALSIVSESCGSFVRLAHPGHRVFHRFLKATPIMLTPEKKERNATA